jgi:hypothetical protein
MFLWHDRKCNCIQFIGFKMVIHVLIVRIRKAILKHFSSSLIQHSNLFWYWFVFLINRYKLNSNFPKLARNLVFWAICKRINAWFKTSCSRPYKNAESSLAAPSYKLFADSDHEVETDIYCLQLQLLILNYEFLSTIRNSGPSLISVVWIEFSDGSYISNSCC